MNKDKIIKKVSKKRFWTLLTGLIASNLLVFNIDDATISAIVAMVSNLGLLVTYVLSEPQEEIIKGEGSSDDDED